MERIACLFIGYLFGMFQTSYLIGKYHHMDIRQYGSGNAGTTNALRTLGKKAGAIDPDRGHVKMRDRHSGGGRGFQKSVRGYSAPAWNVYGSRLCPWT